ncbi:MAG: hypothetical protein QXL86_01105 [Candidatus Aenigmatarchaeota archaeon]
MNKFWLISILLFFLILPEVKAISLGSVVKKDFVNIRDNESAKFEILFWNVEDESYQVQLEIEESPENWFIVIQPREFLINSSAGEEYINLPYLEKPVKASVVRIFVKPENAKAGEYGIIIKAKAGLPSQSIAFFQEREFKLKVKVEGETQEIENKNSTIEKPSLLTGKALEETSSLLSYLLAIIGILVISALIYKYA